MQNDFKKRLFLIKGVIGLVIKKHILINPHHGLKQIGSFSNFCHRDANLTFWMKRGDKTF